MASIRMIALSALILAAPLALAPPVSASVILNGCGDDQSSFGLACGLDELFGGGTITIGDKIFENWKILNVFDGDPADIRVDSIDDKHNPGITFIGTQGVFQFAFAGVTGFRSFEFGFDVEVLEGPLRIKDNELIVEFGPVTHNGGAQVFEGVLDANGDLLVEKIVDCLGETACANRTFSTTRNFSPQALIHVEKTILLQAPDGGSGVQILSITQRFSQTPEPASLLIVGAGLGALLLFRRRR